MTDEKEVYFNIDSRLLLQLGENLVTNRAVALAELVKNSYDADATNVWISLENIKTPGGTIIVEDNGSGMTLSNFKKTWMRIATVDKEQNPISQKYERQKAGEKGIGRFACRRLSKRLKIKSIATTEDGQKEELTAFFDWTAFTPGSDVDKVPVKFSTTPVDYKMPTGTILILEDTKDFWGRWDIRRLRTELTDLISLTTYKPGYESEEVPIEYDPGFNMDFYCPEFPEKEDKLDETFFKNAWAKLTGTIDENGSTSYDIQVINRIINRFDKNFKRTEIFKHLKNTKFEVYIFSYRPDLFTGKEWPLKKARDMGHERGGIKVYADKFRVFGYGVKNDDWLRLDYDRARSLVGLDEEVSGYIEEDKRPGLRLFRNHHLFGHVVFPKKDCPSLEITVNRERLIDNDASEELRRFVRLGIDFATVLYANEIYKDQEAKRKKKEVKEEARRIAEEEATRKAIEAQKRAEELAIKAEEERKKAEERALKAEEERKNIEEEMKKAENERRKAENERRKAEEEARISIEDIAWKKAKEALNKEKEHLRIEEEVRKKEEEIRKKEKEEWKIAEEIAKRAEEERRKAEEEKKKLEEEKIKAEEKELKREREKYEREFSRLRVLASTGTLVLIFDHEISALVEDMDEMTLNFSSILKQLPCGEQKNYTESLESFSNRKEMMEELGEFLGLTIGKESRSEKREWVIRPIMKSVHRPFKWYFKEKGVKFNNNLPDNLRTKKMYQSELVSILHNLMSNALKAIEGEHDRRIEVTGFEENSYIHIQFLDSGKGLDESLWEEVFEPFETHSEPNLKFGVGTGLGLNIVRDIVKTNGGKVMFIYPPDNWKTCVDIALPSEE